MKYTIVAFPQEKTLKQLNSIREYLYTNGFRYTMTAPKGNVHITLSQLEITDASYNLTELKELLSKPLRTQHKFNLSHREIVNQEHTRISSSPELTEKYPKGCAWIAIVFQNTQLFSLAEEMRKVLIPLGIDTSLVYAQKIASTKWKSIKTQEDIYQYIANHMNICNYVRLEKADEAVAHFLHHFPDKEICIDTLALVSDEQQTIREYSLSTKTL